METDKGIEEEDRVPDKTIVLDLELPLPSGVCWVCKDSYSRKSTVDPCQCAAGSRTAHPECLINWMNLYCKGRCPVCCAMFPVRTEQKPRSAWEPDPMLSSNKTKYIMMVCLSLIVTVVCFVSIAHLVHTREEAARLPPERIAVAVVIALVYVLYLFYQSRLYVRIYERLRIYNNKVVEVFDWEDVHEGNVVGRRNLSSYIDQSEL